MINDIEPEHLLRRLRALLGPSHLDRPLTETEVFCEIDDICMYLGRICAALGVNDARAAALKVEDLREHRITSSGDVFEMMRLAGVDSVLDLVGWVAERVVEPITSATIDH